MNTYSHKMLLGASEALGHNCEVFLTNSFSGLPTKAYDLVIHRDSGVSFDDIDLLISKQQALISKKLVNDPTIVQALRGKDSQYLWFLQNLIPHIPTHICRGALGGDFSFEHDEKFILKTTRGNQGLGVMLLLGVDSLESVLEANHARADESYILQPYLSFDCEYRVLTIDNKIMGALKKDKTQDFRANAKRCQISPIKAEQLQKNITELVQRITTFLPNQFLGIDIAIYKNSPLVIEINTTPGFEAFDKEHKTNIAQKLLKEYL